MVTHSGILAWRISIDEEPGRLYSLWGPKELDVTRRAHTHRVYIWDLFNMKMALLSLWKIFHGLQETPCVGRGPALFLPPLLTLCSPASLRVP